MKLKVDDKGAVVVADGKPVYVHDDGKEAAFDAAAAMASIGRLNSEAKGHRERWESAEGKLKAFGDMDPAVAVKALETVKNFDATKFVAAGEVEKIKIEAIKATEDKYKPYLKKVETLESQLYQEKIGGSFARSKYISDKLNIPGAPTQSIFGHHFKIEDGKVVGYDTSGNKLFSRVRPGDLADFDEALEMIVTAYPYRDNIMKGTGATGSGSQSSGAAAGGAKTITRAQFESLSQYERSQKVTKEGYKVVD